MTPAPPTPAPGEPSAGWIEGREHVLPVRIYYEDTDFTGVVYHGNYLRYFERGRSDFLRLAGVRHAELLDQETPSAFTIVRMEVRTAYDRVKGPRLFISQRIVRGETLIAQAAVMAACIGLDGRPRKPPPGMAAALSPFFAPDADV